MHTTPGVSGEIRVTVRREGPEMLLLMVEDDGVGWTGEGQPRGSGLGSRILKAMGTNLRAQVIYDESYCGTRATLTLGALRARPISRP